MMIKMTIISTIICNLNYHSVKGIACLLFYAILQSIMRNSGCDCSKSEVNISIQNDKDGCQQFKALIILSWSADRRLKTDNDQQHRLKFTNSVSVILLTNNSQTTHKQLTNNSQTTHRQLTDNSQTTHKQLTNNSQTTHRQLTNNSQTTHKQLTNNSQTTHRQLTDNSQTTQKQHTDNSQTTHKQLTDNSQTTQKQLTDNSQTTHKQLTNNS